MGLGGLDFSENSCALWLASVENYLVIRRGCACSFRVSVHSRELTSLPWRVRALFYRFKNGARISRILRGARAFIVVPIGVALGFMLPSLLHGSLSLPVTRFDTKPNHRSVESWRINERKATTKEGRSNPMRPDLGNPTTLPSPITNSPKPTRSEQNGASAGIQSARRDSARRLSGASGNVVAQQSAFFRAAISVEPTLAEKLRNLSESSARDSRNLLLDHIRRFKRLDAMPWRSTAFQIAAQLRNPGYTIVGRDFLVPASVGATFDYFWKLHGDHSAYSESVRSEATKLIRTHDLRMRGLSLEVFSHLLFRWTEGADLSHDIGAYMIRDGAIVTSRGELPSDCGTPFESRREALLRQALSVFR